MEKSDLGLAAYGLILATLDTLEQKNLITPLEGRKIFAEAASTIEGIGKTLGPLGVEQSVEILRGTAATALGCKMSK